MNNHKLDNSKDNLYMGVSAGLKFFYSLTIYLLAQDFKRFLFAGSTSLLSKICESVAMILPVKIVLLIAPNQQLPAFAEQLFSSNNELILCLSFMVLVIICLEAGIKKFYSYVFNNLIARINTVTMVTVEKERKEMVNVIESCITVNSKIALFIILLTVLGLVFPQLLLVFIILAGVFYTVFFTLTSHYQHAGNRKKSNRLPGVGKYLFIAAFVFIIYEAIVNHNQYSLIILIVGLVITRQLGVILGQILAHSLKLSNLRNTAFQITGKNP